MTDLEDNRGFVPKTKIRHDLRWNSEIEWECLSLVKIAGLWADYLWLNDLAVSLLAGDDPVDALFFANESDLQFKAELLIQDNRHRSLNLLATRNVQGLFAVLIFLKLEWHLCVFGNVVKLLHAYLITII